MEIKVNITKLKKEKENLHRLEHDLEIQIARYEKVMHECMRMSSTGISMLPFKKVLEYLNQEKRTLRRMREVLEEVIRAYEQAERKITNANKNPRIVRYVFEKICVKDVQQVLSNYQIKFK